MPKLIISLDGVVIKEAALSKDRTSLGRRPYNDIVIDHLVISGEHAVVQMSGSDAFIEDLNSTNGTYVNGVTVKRQQLHHQDIVEIGKYSLQYVDEGGGSGPTVTATDAPVTYAAPANAFIRVISGIAVGREIALVKQVTTIGKPGVAAATITKNLDGFVVAHVEGASRLILNGATMGSKAVALKDGDMIELAGTQMQFVQA